MLWQVQKMTAGSKMPGTVYLVGAGPGHPGLITRLGYDLLQKCDAVAYDALIPMELIVGLPDAVEKHYVGKRSGKHSAPQSEINELLVALARRGLNVVRLKGGDPFIFGRLSEEAEYLSTAGIPVVMVPGVTAASAAAAASGFSLTSRQVASWVFLATGHPADHSSTPVPWDKIAALRGGTLVVYMGISSIDKISAQLLSFGMSPDIPAVVVQEASTGKERCVEAPLARIAEECRLRHMESPALVVIGESVRWRGGGPQTQKGPLAGKRVLVTSPAESIGRVCRLLREAGAEPVPYPTVIRRRFDDTEGWAAFSRLVDSGGMCFFESESQVNNFLHGLIAHGMDARSLGHFKVIAARKSTEWALISRGIRPDRVLSDSKLQTLTDCLSDLDRNSSLPLVWLREGSNPCPSNHDLQENCRPTIALALSLDSTASWEPHWKEELSTSPMDYIIFTGIAEVTAFVELLGIALAHDIAGRSCVTAMDDRIAYALGEHGLPVDLKPTTPGLEAVVAAIVTHSQRKAAKSLD
jgi:uroporphyrinogen III methyltransferase / synthase